MLDLLDLFLDLFYFTILIVMVVMVVATVLMVAGVACLVWLYHVGLKGFKDDSKS